MAICDLAIQSRSSRDGGLTRIVPLFIFSVALISLPGCERRYETAGVEDNTPIASPAKPVSGPFGKLRKVIHAEGAETTGVARGVRMARGGSEITAELGMELLEGDAVSTDGQTRVVLESTAGTEILLGPDSEITLGKSSLFLKLGRLFSKLREQFRLETEFVVAGVEGTEVDLSVDSEDVVSLAVLDGRVRVASKTERWSAREYGEGEHGVIRGEEEPTKSLLDPTERQNIRQWVEEFERPSKQTGAGVAR